MGLGGDSTLMAGMTSHPRHPPLPTKSFFAQPPSPRRPAPPGAQQQQQQQHRRPLAALAEEAAAVAAAAEPPEGGEHGGVGSWLEAMPSDVSAVPEEDLARYESSLPPRWSTEHEGEAVPGGEPGRPRLLPERPSRPPPHPQSHSPFGASPPGGAGGSQQQRGGGVESAAEWAAAHAGGGNRPGSRPGSRAISFHDELEGSPPGAHDGPGSPQEGGTGSPTDSWRQMQGGRGWPGSGGGGGGSPPQGSREASEGGGGGDSTIGSASSAGGGTAKHSLPISFRWVCVSWWVGVGGGVGSSGLAPTIAFPKCGGQQQKVLCVPYCHSQSLRLL